ncbi:hypothetical protein DYBT9275_00078 [Dyadobacter sp. CECT 9275]|uniref:YMGG-like Gly-zipper domain-containing protein n=1 Tax=Dyadobacter helix TaxID=2822344 RepID=A0A916NAK3_9BACT|nr:glycine zipper family protein [Dyadobacter sp. CECT 9275]CAG4988421.1 hypothetical protein DYBT9275_00078 [Dyadobacter sp. CECT 9275]
MKLPMLMLGTTLFLSACDSRKSQEIAMQQAKQMAVDSMKNVISKKAVIDSMNRVMAEREEEIKRLQEKKNKQYVASSYATAPSATKKKKWNHTAKGAVVGAGTGAVTGAIINKNRAEGALIGSLIGAGVGAGTGAIVDASQKKKQKTD